MYMCIVLCLDQQIILFSVFVLYSIYSFILQTKKKEGQIRFFSINVNGNESEHETIFRLMKFVFG